MRKGNSSRSKQKSSAIQLTLFSDISIKPLRYSGIDNAQYKRTVSVTEDIEELRKQLPKRIFKSIPLCFIERTIISKMISKGASLISISKFLGRGPNSVVLEVRRSGGRDTYDALKAHEAAQKRHKLRGIKFRGPLKCIEDIPDKQLKKRIENLEMQLEIVTDTLKELIHEQQSNKNDK